MPYYIVQRVRACPRGQTVEPDIPTSRTLEDFGFMPEAGKDRNNMNTGAVPKLGNIVVRYEHEHAHWFKLIRVEKKDDKQTSSNLNRARLRLQPMEKRVP